MVENLKALPIGKNKYIYVSPHHTFGTDAVILADFASRYNFKSAIDLGTGCGIIGMLFLRDNPDIKVYGVDISYEAYLAAEKSVKDFSYPGFIPVNSDLNVLKGKVPFGCHDLVVCNPPYKSAAGGIKNSDPVIKTARHETKCSLEDIIRVSSKLLKTSGKLCVCQRPERLGELITLMSKYKTEPKRLRIVCKKQGEEPWLVLVSGTRCAKPGMRIDPPLFVYNNGELSPEMLEIYGPYKEEFL